MKNYLVLYMILLFAGGCANQSGKLEKKPSILVTILPEKCFVEKIAENDFNISVLVPPGANPSTYSLLPSQMIDITQSSTWFRMGYVGFELSWSERIREANRKMKVIDLSSGIDLISSGSGDHPTSRIGVDPHTWMSPQRVKRMALQIRDELILLNPAKKESYNAGFDRFMNEIQATDSAISRILKNNRGKHFISFHPSLSYFAKDYGLIQHSIEEGGKEPTPARMAALSQIARKEGIRAIYIQSDYDKEFARTFADEIHGKIIQITPLNPDWSGNLISIARLLSKN